MQSTTTQPNASSSTDPSPPAPSRRPGRFVRLILFALATVALCFFVVPAIYHQLRAIHWRDLHPQAGPIALALVCLMALRFANVLSIQALLRSLSYRIGLIWLTGALWVASLGRYVPGKMMAGLSATVLIMRRGVPLSASAAAMLLNTAMMLVVGVMFSTPLLFTPQLRQKFPGLGLASIGIIICGIILLHPYVVMRLCNFVFRRARLPSRLGGRQYLLATLMLGVRAFWLGAALWCCARAVAPADAVSFPLCLSAMSLAGIIGFLVFVVPAGIGAQEAVLILVLTPQLGPTASLVALLFRGMQAIGDALAGAIGMLLLHPAISGIRTPMETVAGDRAEVPDPDVVGERGPASAMRVQ